ncbi:multicellular organismal development [Nesidiocoris tenuis]|uniref:RNA-directed DNA polymerase n=1 Tax=Nesidiocoris tenuis TaxID=355587 RepID=A0ABN7AF16_9HEMI|nr:multicellular organismal development [Nesidiocoris tenuis]
MDPTSSSTASASPLATIACRSSAIVSPTLPICSDLPSAESSLSSLSAFSPISLSSTVSSLCLSSNSYPVNQIDASSGTSCRDNDLWAVPLKFLPSPLPHTSVLALYDTGSSLSFVGRIGLSSIGVYPPGENSSALELKNPIVAQMANGVRTTISFVYRLKFLIGCKKLEFEFHYLDSLSFPFVLGLDFIRQAGIITDAQKNRWYFSSNSNQTFKFIQPSPNKKILDPCLPSNCCGIQQLTDQQRVTLDNVVSRGFSSLKNSSGFTSKISHQIDVGSASPIRQRAYVYSPKVLEAMCAELDKMLLAKIVEPSHAAWASPVVMVRKPNNTYRFCIDFRRVNAVTKKDSYPMPNINTLLDSLRQAAFLSKLDLEQAFLQVPLADEISRDVTSFIVPGRGLFRFRSMPFGLSNSPATFQRLADSIFLDLYPQVVVFLDDILICTPDFDSHCSLLEEVFRRLKESGLRLNKEKCEFGCKEVRYLGYRVNIDGISADPEKVEVVTSYPPPTNVTELRRFLGMSGWYRRFIPGFSTIVAPLTALLSKGKPWVWAEPQITAFESLKSYLTSAPILGRPDFNSPFILQTDASQNGLGAALVQMQDDQERVITFCSRTLTAPERNYSVTEKECLAVIYGIEKNRQYLEGSEFTVITDHSCLKWLLELKSPTGRLARWTLRLQPYNFHVQYRKGNLNSVADALSRLPPSTNIAAVTDVADANSQDTKRSSGKEIDDEWFRQKIYKVKTQPENHPDWKIDGNSLFYYRKSFLKGELEDPSEDWKLVVPLSSRSRILSECHDDPQAGHLGVSKTHWRIGRLYYWPGMYNDIVRYVTRCDVCQRVKPSNTKPRGMMFPRYLKAAWDVVSLDIMGPFPRSSTGNTHLLVFEDLFTKWVELVPIRSTTSAVILDKFKSVILNRYGTPSTIITDNASNFVSSTVRRLTQSCGIQHQTTPLYHCQANPTERANRNVRQLIRTYIDQPRHTRWDCYIGELQFALNSTVHSSTKYSPAFLNFGRELRPSRSLHSTVVQPNSSPASTDLDEWALRMSKLNELKHLVEKHLLKASTDQGRRYNLRRRPDKFTVGEAVLRKSHHLSSAEDRSAAKLFPKYEGPFTVISVSQGGTCRLQDASGKDAGLWHPSQLKPYHHTSTAGEGCMPENSMSAAAEVVALQTAAGVSFTPS